MRRIIAMVGAVLLIAAACTSTPQPTSPISSTVPPPITQTATSTPSPSATASARIATTSPAQISPLASPLPTPVVANSTADNRRLYLPFIIGPIPLRPTLAPTVTPQPAPSSTPAPTPLPTDPLLGINVADTRDVALLRRLGFGWIEVFLPPTAPVPPFKILYRIGLGDAVSGHEEDIAQFGKVVDGVLRDHGKYIDAYAIGNEPNLSREWKGGQPDAKLYTRLLKLAYDKIKASHPNATVISAGLAPTGGSGAGFIDDLLLRARCSRRARRTPSTPMAFTPMATPLRRSKTPRK